MSARVAIMDESQIQMERPVEMVIKQYDGRTYLLTVNPSAPVQRQIRLDRDRFPNPTITLLPERQSIPFQNGSFDAKWGPYDVRIYEIASGSPPAAMTSPLNDGRVGGGGSENANTP